MNKLYELVKRDWEIGLGMVQEVNSWDNSLSHLDYISMEEFDECLGHLPAIDIAYKIHYGDFNPCDDYFSFNAYENLISYDEYELATEIIEFRYEIVDRFVELYRDGHVESWSQEVLEILDSFYQCPYCEEHLEVKEGMAYCADCNKEFIVE